MRARRSVRSARAAAICLAVCVAAGLLAAASPGMATVHVKKGDPVIAAAGNIACDPTNPSFHGGRGTKQGCRMRAVSNLLLRPHGRPRYRTVLALGDTQYTCGGLSAFRQSYRPSWGRVFSVTRPIVGDKDYRTTASAPGATGCSPPPGAAAGFFSYFGSKPYVHTGSTPGSGAYYSFDVPSGCSPRGVHPCWHFIALNGNCNKAIGCVPGTEQYDWLAADLAAHPNTSYGCTLAFWHQPRFSSGVHGSNAAYDAIWRLLYRKKVDVVLNAHEHVYERFARQDPDGRADPNGIREFIVGTGGASHVRFPTGARLPTSQASNAKTFGILTLRLHRDGYDWRFIPAAGGRFTDASTVPTPCH